MKRNATTNCLMAISAALLCLGVSFAHADELLRNGSFQELDRGVPKHWSIRNNKQEVEVDSATVAHPEVQQALQVRIVRDGGSSYGEIAQSVRVQPNTVYRFQGELRSSKGQTAFFQIKRFKAGKEIERKSLPWSSPSWQRVIQHIDSGDADEFEVLCRFRQKKSFVGIVCWYTNLSLAPITDASNLADSVTAISPPIAAPPSPIPMATADNPELQIAAPGVDQYVTLLGAGNQTGSDWENAAPAIDGGLQTAWDKVGPGNTMYLGSGEYQDAILEIRAGGSGPAAMRSLRGVDTGNSLPVIVGSLDMDNIRDGWQTMLVGTANTGYWKIDGLKFRNCSCAVKLYGSNVGVRFSNLDITRVREAFTIEGLVNLGDEYPTRDVIISDCSVNVYTKRGVRIRDGVSDLRIIRVAVDAGGQEWFREAFPIGFQVDSDDQMPECRDITFIDCSAKGNWHPNTEGYWNGDGFCAERRVRGLTYIRCYASNNTDGGWDDKSANPVLIDCVSVRNKRNFRFWSKPGPALLQNCVSAFAYDHGGQKPGVGLWQASGSYLRADHSTFYGNGCAVSVEADGDSTFCELNGCILAGDSGAKLLSVEDGGSVSKLDTVEGTIGNATSDPQLVAPSPDAADGIRGFGSTRYPDQGVRF